MTWKEITRRAVVDTVITDNCLAMAAQLAYYFFFSLFPALLFVVALASYFPIAQLVDEIVATMGRFAPGEVLSIVTDQMRKISSGDQGGLLTLGALAAIWSSSAAMTAIIDTLNRAYDVEEHRPWWKVRLIAIALTVGVSLFIVISVALMIVGPELAEQFARQLSLGPVFEWTWKIAQWPLIFGFITFAVALIYYFAPDIERNWVWLSPGAIVATMLWVIASLGFRLYVVSIGSYTETYGAIGGVMILLLWFYLAGLAILFGAEINAEVDRANGTVARA